MLQINGIIYTTFVNSTRYALEEIKRGSGLSWRELARRAGTAHSALIAYAKGRHDPGVQTLERVALAAGYDLVIEVRPRLSAPEIRTLEMHRAIAERLTRQPQEVITQALDNLTVAREADSAGNTGPYLDTWESLLLGPLDRLTSVMTSTDQAARDLRQSSPFAGVLSDAERLEVLMRTDGADIVARTGRTEDDVREELRRAIQAGREMVARQP